MRKITDFMMRFKGACSMLIAGKCRRFMFIPILLTALFSSGTISAAVIDLTSFYPGGEKGLFLDSETATVTLTGKNTTGSLQAITVTYVTTDFNGSAAGSSVVESFSVNANSTFTRSNVNLGSITGRRGWFCVRATVTQSGITITQKATGYCVMGSNVSTNSFISANANCSFDYLLVPAMQKIGVNSRGIGFRLGYAGQAWRTNGYLSNITSSIYWTATPSLELVGYISTDRISTSGFWPSWYPTPYPYPEAYFTEFGEFVTAVANACNGRISKWVISEEYDASFVPPSTPSGNYMDEVTRYIRQVQIAYEKLKEVNEYCTVTALTAAGTEELPQLQAPVFWGIAKEDLLPASAPYGGITGHFDIFGPDAYCNGNWQISTTSIDSIASEMFQLRRMLLATEAEQEFYKGNAGINISEYGCAVPFHYETDSEVVKRTSNLLARYIILARSVPNVLSLSLWGMSASAGLTVYNGTASTDASPVWDWGFWRMEYTGTPNYSPRPWVAALITINQLIGNASNPVEVVVGVGGFYSWTFDKGANTVAALWTSSKSAYSITLNNVPAGCTKYDLMGNAQALSSGSNTLTVSESPVFISTASGSAAALRSSIGAMLPSTETSPLVLHLKLNETTGSATAADFSGCGNNGTLENMDTSTCWVAGKFGNALNFDGVNDRINVPASTSLNNISSQVSISFWFKTSSSIASPQVFMDKNLGLYVKAMSTTSITVGHTNLSTQYTTVTGLPAFNDSNWHHVVFTWDGSSTKLYFDETLKTTISNVTGTINTGTTALHIARGDYIGAAYWAGAMDDIRIYNRGLKEEEFKGLVLHLKMNENSGAGTVANDSSCFLNDGTLQYMSSNPWVAGRYGYALNFRGTNDRVNVPTSSSLSTFTQASISLWFKIASTVTVNNNGMIEKGTGLYIKTSSTGGATSLTVGHSQLSTQYTTINNLPPFNDNAWHHVVFTWDGSGTKLYLDGRCVKILSSVTGTIDTSGATTLHIGEGGYIGVNDLNGQVDDVRIFNRALTANEVYSLYCH